MGCWGQRRRRYHGLTNFEKKTASTLKAWAITSHPSVKETLTTVFKSSARKCLAPKMDREDGQMKRNSGVKRENVKKENEKKRRENIMLVQITNHSAIETNIILLTFINLVKVGSYDENSPYLWYCFLYQSYGETFHFFLVLSSDLSRWVLPLSVYVLPF